VGWSFTTTGGSSCIPRTAAVPPRAKALSRPDEEITLEQVAELERRHGKDLVNRVEAVFAGTLAALNSKA